MGTMLATLGHNAPAAMNFAIDGGFAAAKWSAAPAAIEVALCCDQAMLKSAQRLRYEVYCAEFGRQSPYADHARKLITDPLDRFGHTFIAIEDGETIGTLRTNFASEGPLGALEDHYGMRVSKHHPARTAICTKFIVKRSRRGSLVFFKLLAAWLEHVMRNGIAECYIDCTPNLGRFYERCEFQVCGAPFLHDENGLSFPMMLDLTCHSKALCERFCGRALAA
jgi:predicted GNAT family N-acyltransferase